MQQIAASPAEMLRIPLSFTALSPVDPMTYICLAGRGRGGGVDVILKGLQRLMWRNPGHSETLVSPLQIQIQIQGDFTNNACILKGRWDA